MAACNTIKIKTETESLLYKYYCEEKAQREKLQCLVHDLKGQLEKLQQEFKNVQEQRCAAEIQKDPEETTQYETDEEELARETEWVRQISRKKRKLNVSLSPPQAQGSKTSEPVKEKQKVKKIPLPPPIIVENVKNYQQFYDFLLSSLEKDSFTIKMLSGDSVKINTNNEDSYRAAATLLRQQSYLWHSYENKQDRPIRVMAKNLHSSCLPDRIVDDLAAKGFKIQEAVNKRSWRKKEPLNMFMLSFQKEEDINKIYTIKTILGCKVEIQPLKTSKLIPQCKKCQAYGHTQKYCSKEPRCVKCTGKHLTKDCQKPAGEKPKCIHCGDAHPASYRGCTVAKELQSLKMKNVKKTEKTPSASTSVPSTTRKPSANMRVTKDVSFAQVMKGVQAKQPHLQQKPDSLNVDEKLNKILDLLSSFDERINKLESSNKAATHKQKL